MTTHEPNPNSQPPGVSLDEVFTDDVGRGSEMTLNQELDSEVFGLPSGVDTVNGLVVAHGAENQPKVYAVGSAYNEQLNRTDVVVYSLKTNERGALVYDSEQPAVDVETTEDAGVASASWFGNEDGSGTVFGLRQRRSDGAILIQNKGERGSVEISQDMPEFGELATREEALALSAGNVALDRAGLRVEPETTGRLGDDPGMIERMPTDEEFAAVQDGKIAELEEEIADLRSGFTEEAEGFAWSYIINKIAEDEAISNGHSELANDKKHDAKDSFNRIPTEFQAAANVWLKKQRKLEDDRRDANEARDK